VDYEDVRYDAGDPNTAEHRESWNKVKSTLGLPKPNLPYYIDADVKLTQSNTILRYLGRKHNLVTDSIVGDAMVDFAGDELYDIRNSIVGLAYRSGSSYEEKAAEWKEHSLPKHLAIIATLLGDNDWVGASTLTWPDFVAYELLTQITIMFPGELEKSDNGVKALAFIARFAALPAIKAYLSSDRFIERPINNPTAAFR
jgi:glutathione S-transferase